MKQLHRDDLFGWSVFDEARNLDFHSVLWRRDEGNVAIDPLPLTPHDETRLRELGGVAAIVVTNSDHVRAAAALATRSGAELLGPRAEADAFPIACKRWLADGDEVVPGLRALELHGSKTPGELALLLEDTTLVTGDLIRAHRGGALCLLPDAKLRDRERALASLERLTRLGGLRALLPGDGWPVFRDARRLLQELLARERGDPAPSWRLTILRVFVTDWERALRFYAETLGIPLAARNDEWHWAELDTGEGVIALERVAPDDPEAAALVGRFVGASLAVPDVEATWRELVERGVEFLEPPQRQPWGGILAHLRDPDGNVLTLLGRAEA